MKLLNSKSIGLYLVTAVSLTFLFYFYGDVLRSPNKFLFGESGDAIKNYFTYVAHSKQPGIVNSGIMNYPYGENFLYLDCHPALTVALKILAVPFPGITDYSAGIINFLMIIGYLISAIFIYLILHHLKVNALYAALGGFAISVLSPQIYRLTGHFGLSYIFMVPLTWYLFIRFLNSKSKIKWSVGILLNNLFWYLIHGYMGMIAVSFVLIAYLSHLFIYDHKNVFKWRSWLNFIIQAILPMVLFWLLIKLSDIHTGRNKTPGGFMESLANIYSVFLPHKGPLKAWIDQYLQAQTSWEGWAYVGIATSFVIVIFIINNLLKIFKVWIINDKTFIKNPVLIPALISSVVLLLVAMGYPFILNMEYLLDDIQVINNFRAIGRFAWPFYYVITVWAIYYTYLFFESRKKIRYLWIPFIVLIPVSYTIESLIYHKETSKKVNVIENYFNPNYIPEYVRSGLDIINASDYQAIIPLPYYLIGSEDYKKTASDKMYKLSMTFGYHTGLPILSNYSTNTSIIESRNLYQVLAPVTYTKEIKEDIKSDKPFLIVYDKEELTSNEKNILSRSKLMFDNESYSLYSISKDMLLVDSSNAYLSSFQEHKKNLVAKSGFLVKEKDLNKFLLYHSYDSLNGNIIKTGKASYQGELKNYNKLAEIKPFSFKAGQPYIISFWIYNDDEEHGQKAMDGIVFLEHRNTNESLPWPVVYPPSQSVNIDGKWTLVEIEFTSNDDKYGYIVCLKGSDKSVLNCYIDDLLIREKGCDVYKVLKEDNNGVYEMFYNNHRITRR